MTSSGLVKALSKEQSYTVVPSVTENTVQRGYFKPMQERGVHAQHPTDIEAGLEHFNEGKKKKKKKPKDE